MNKMPAAQYGGIPPGLPIKSPGLISILGFRAAVQVLGANGLHIEYTPGSGYLVSREQGSYDEDPLGALKLVAAYKLFTVNLGGKVGDPNDDSPPVEIRANFILNPTGDGQADVALNQNAAEYYAQFSAAFSASGTYEDKLNFLMARHKISSDAAAAELAAAGIPAS